jgi:serine/threonine-protein kinase
MDSWIDGRVIKDRYLLKSLAGRGKIGCVFEASDISLSDRTVAVKEICIKNQNPSDDSIKLAALDREVNLLSGLKHKGIPSIYDSFILDNFGYIITEFVFGQNLANILKAYEGGMPEAEIIRIALEICKILDYLHNLDNPIIYGDLKPGNILVDDDGIVKLVDFSLSRQKSVGESGIGNNIIGGTPGYAPPEQFLPGGIVDEKSDIFAIGTTLFYLLTGQNPPINLSSPGNSQTNIFTAINKSISPSLKYVIEKCIRVDNADKYENVREVEQDLLAISQRRALPSLSPKKRQTAYAVITLIVFLITGMSVFWAMTKQKTGNSGGSIVSVKSLTKGGSAFEKSTDKIVLKFSQPMDTQSVQEALEINCHRIKSMKWSDNDKLLEIPINDDNVYLKYPIMLTLDARIAQSKNNKSLNSYSNEGFGSAEGKLAIQYGSDN